VLIDTVHLSVDLGRLRLIATEVSLEEVVVTAEKPLYSASIDRKVYNVDRDLASKAGSASELLQNVPSVQVDIEGTVSLRGSANVLIMVNGKTSPLMNKNSATVLQQMPASTIDRIEVITNPSAKYKPDGTAGILNIVLKKNTSFGLNGNIASNAGNDDRYNGTLRLNYNPGPVNLFGSYGVRRDRRNRVNTDARVQNDSIAGLTYYNETMNSFAHPLSHSLSGGAEIRLGEKDQCGLSGDYFYNVFTRTESADKLLETIDHVPASLYNRSRYDDEFEKEYSATAFFEHAFPEEDHSMRVEFTASRAPEQEDNRYTNLYVLPVQATGYDNTLIRNSDDSRQLSLEYTRPMGDEASLEAGYRGEFSSGDRDYGVTFFDPGAQTFVTDISKTNRFLYDQSIHALYATYKRSFGLFGLMAGLRAEQASVSANLVTTNVMFSNTYFSLFPTLHLSYKLSPTSELQLSYSRRTNRPDGEELNPFPEYRDPRNVSAGNPKLLPEYIHSFELGCQYQEEGISVLPAFFFRSSSNKFTTVTQALNDTTLLTTRQNLSSDRSGGVELVVSVTIGRLLTLHGSTYAFLNQIDASNLGYDAKKSITTWSGNITCDLNLSPSTRLQVNSVYNSSRLTAQGEYSPSYAVNTGLRHELLDGSLTLLVTIADLFKTMRREYALSTPELMQTVVNKRDSRIVYFGFTYRFGTQAKKSKEEQLRYEEGL
jgi:outer membrane receptor protein involved in Fe transport